MPRKNRTRVSRLPSVSGVESPAPVQAEAHASPTRNPAPYKTRSDVDDLVDGLKGLEPGLMAFVKSREEEEAKAERAAGMKARATQEGNAPLITAEQTPWFQQGYMEMHGQVAGADVARKMRALFDENKGKPGWNPEQEIRSFLASESEGMSDQDALKGYLPHVMRERDSILNDWSKLQTEQVRADAALSLQARARDIAETPIREDEEGVYVDPSQTRHQLYQQFVEQGMTLGKTRPELAEMFTLALVNEAISKRDPSVLDVANIRDASGIALIDVFGKTIIDARSKAETLQKAGIHAELTQARTDNLLGLNELLRTSPHDPRLDIDSLKLHAGPHGVFNDADGRELASFYEKVVEARQKDAQSKKILLDLSGPNARLTAAMPEAKPVMQAKYAQVWEGWRQNILNGDENATARFVSENLALHQLWGVPDDRLKSLLTRINTETLEDGKPATEFLRAYQVYAAIKDSANPDLIMDLTDERSRTMLRHFHEMILEGKPEADALAAAKQLMTPEAEERGKRLATPQVNQVFRAELNSKLEGGHWFTFGMTGGSANREMFIAPLMEAFDRNVRLLGNVEQASKITLAQVDEILVRDANDNWTQRPDPVVLGGKSQRDFEKGLKAYTLDLTAEYEKADEPLGRERKFALQRGGQGDHYIVMIGGIPKGRVELSEILARGAAADLTQSEALTLSALQQRASEKGMPQLQGDEIDLRWPEVMKLRELRAISTATFEELSIKRRKYQQQQLINGSAQARQERAAMLAGMEPRGVLDEPGPLPEDTPVNPGGKNLKTADYAMLALEKGNLTFALTAQAEGFMTRVHSDPARGKNIGLGFSVTSRTQPEVRSMLKRSGVPEQEIDAVLAGKMEITPEAVMRLHEIAVVEYERKAERALGAQAWQRLTPEAKAVLTDMAWQTGNPAQFKTVLEAMRKGDWKGASANLSMKYTDRKTGEVKDDTRRINLWRLMLSGRQTFAAHIKKFTTK